MLDAVLLIISVCFIIKWIIEIFVLSTPKKSPKIKKYKHYRNDKDIDDFFLFDYLERHDNK